MLLIILEENTDLKLLGYKGLSSLDEAGIKRISELAEFIAKEKLKAIYIENSVPVKTV